MPSIKMKTHKGVKKRFKVSATGKVSHKRCGSSHLNSHKSGKRIRRLRKKSFMRTEAHARQYRIAMGERANRLRPEDVSHDEDASRPQAEAAAAAEPSAPTGEAPAAE